MDAGAEAPFEQEDKVAARRQLQHIRRRIMGARGFVGLPEASFSEEVPNLEPTDHASLHSTPSV